MTETTIGHNQPPPTTEDELGAIKTAIEERAKALFERVEQLRAGLALAPDPTDEATATRLTDFIRQVKQARADLEKARKAEKGPFDARARAVQELFKARLDPLDQGVKALEQKLGRYQAEMAREAARQREQQEAERRARLDAMEKELADRDVALEAYADEVKRGHGSREALIEQQRQRDELAERLRKEGRAPKVQKQQVRGEYGSVGVSTKAVDFEVVDPSAVPLDYLQVDEQAVRQAIRDGVRDIPGIRIFETERFHVR